MKEKVLLLAPLLQMLTDIKPLPKELEEMLINEFNIQKIVKGEHLLTEGSVCKKFVVFSKWIATIFS